MYVQQMHETFLWKLLFSFLLHLRFYQTGLDEPVDTLHRHYLWLVDHRMPGPKNKFNF